MTSEQFNEKYKDYLEEGHYGIDGLSPLVIDWFDEQFQELIKIKGFQYSQIKLKFGMGRFYCENVPKEKVNEIENTLTRFYQK
jgi:hypothetical protein